MNSNQEGHKTMAAQRAFKQTKKAAKAVPPRQRIVTKLEVVMASRDLLGKIYI